jgi:hypothetical protein
VELAAEGNSSKRIKSTVGTETGTSKAKLGRPPLDEKEKEKRARERELNEELLAKQQEAEQAEEERKEQEHRNKQQLLRDEQALVRDVLSIFAFTDVNENALILRSLTADQS